ERCWRSQHFRSLREFWSFQGLRALTPLRFQVNRSVRTPDEGSVAIPKFSIDLLARVVPWFKRLSAFAILSVVEVSTASGGYFIASCNMQWAADQAGRVSTSKPDWGIWAGADNPARRAASRSAPSHQSR